VSELYRAVGYKPETPVRLGIEQFVHWYMSYHGAAAT
jgi:hypothetical protein